MDNVKPGALAMIVGGALLLIGSFLDWQSFFGFGQSAWDRGLLGFFLLVIAAIAIAVPAIQSFAPQVNLPNDILGMSMIKIATLVGISAFLISFGLLFIFEGFQIGSILATLGSGAIVVGGHLLENDGGAVGGETRTI